MLLSQGRNAEKRNDLQAARKAYENASFLKALSLEMLIALARILREWGCRRHSGGEEKYLYLILILHLRIS
jgi:hypothetical protein